MVEGIVLAAGSSSRAGCFKMELPLGDKMLIERSIEGMYNVCSNVIVVGGYKVERLREILSVYPKVQVVENANWQSGMFSSVKVGVKQVSGTRFFLLPADVPLVSESVFRKLLDASAKIAIPVFKGTKGHPVLFDSSIKACIVNESDGSTLRDVIHRTGYTAVEVDEEEILIDVDTQADIENARVRLMSRETGRS